MVMAWAAGKVPLREMLRDWLIVSSLIPVTIGNIIGGVDWSAAIGSFICRPRRLA
jgi:formate/nitrite transporter FocA (FNT family)